jgi:hypothetical protein
MNLINFNNSSTIRLKRFFKNLERLLISTNLIKAKYIEFYIKTINALNRSK